MLPCELPSQAALNSIVGPNFSLIEVYVNLDPTDLISWLCHNCTDTVLFAPQFGNPMEHYEPYNNHFIYFKNPDDACHFRLRWS